eukprot:m.214321 g.214321  ORF g.214321 m.214321 type:complete len:524 (-) comp15100_c5_seq4:2579-4150(-)
MLAMKTAAKATRPDQTATMQAATKTSATMQATTVTAPQQERITFKTWYNGDVRRFTFHADDCDVATTADYVGALYNLDAKDFGSDWCIRTRISERALVQTEEQFMEYVHTCLVKNQRKVVPLDVVKLAAVKPSETSPLQGQTGDAAEEPSQDKKDQPRRGAVKKPSSVVPATQEELAVLQATMDSAVTNLVTQQHQLASVRKALHDHKIMLADIQGKVKESRTIAAATQRQLRQRGESVDLRKAIEAKQSQLQLRQDQPHRAPETSCDTVSKQAKQDPRALRLEQRAQRQVQRVQKQEQRAKKQLAQDKRQQKDVPKKQEQDQSEVVEAEKAPFQHNTNVLLVCKPAFAQQRTDAKCGAKSKTRVGSLRIHSQGAVDARGGRGGLARFTAKVHPVSSEAIHNGRPFRSCVTLVRDTLCLAVTPEGSVTSKPLVPGDQEQVPDGASFVVVPNKGNGSVSLSTPSGLFLSVNADGAVTTSKDKASRMHFDIKPVPVDTKSHRTRHHHGAAHHAKRAALSTPQVAA